MEYVVKLHKSGPTILGLGWSLQCPISLSAASTGYLWEIDCYQFVAEVVVLIPPGRCHGNQRLVGVVGAAALGEKIKNKKNLKHHWQTQPPERYFTRFQVLGAINGSAHSQATELMYKPNKCALNCNEFLSLLTLYQLWAIIGGLHDGITLEQPRPLVVSLQPFHDSKLYF